MSMNREFPGKFESSNLSRDNVSWEIGRIVVVVMNMTIISYTSYKYYDYCDY